MSSCNLRTCGPVSRRVHAWTSEVIPECAYGNNLAFSPSPECTQLGVSGEFVGTGSPSLQTAFASIGTVCPDKLAGSGMFKPVHSW